MLWRIAIILLGVAFMFGLLSYQVNNAEEYGAPAVSFLLKNGT